MARARPVTTRPAARALTYAQIPREPPKFFWLGRLQMKVVNVLVGHEKIGKGFLGAFLAACASNGDDMPDGTETCFAGPVTVLMITPEDNRTNVQGYRLMAAGANLANIVDFTPGFRLDEAGIAALRAELQAIRDDPSRPNVGLIWIDPLSAIARITRPNDVVRAEIVGPLEAIAEEFDLAVVTLVHDTKAGKAAAGSKAITEAARMVLTVERVHLGEQDIRLITVTAANNTPDTLAPVGYTIVGTEIEGVPVGRVEFLEVPDEAIAFVPGPVPLKDKIIAILNSHGRQMHYRTLWEALRLGREDLHIDPDGSLKVGTVRTALSRLKADPESGVLGIGGGYWDVFREPPPVPPVVLLEGLPATPGGPDEDQARQSDPLADFCDACLQDDHGACTAPPVGGTCACQQSHQPALNSVDELLRDIESTLGEQ